MMQGKPSATSAVVLTSVCGVAVLAALTLVYATIGITERVDADPVLQEPDGVSPACAAWDRSASDALSALSDGRARHDASFRLRRARRNCAEGWLELACGDYQALLAGPLSVGDGKWHHLVVPTSCRLGTTH